MRTNLILAINPGSTSTKIAVFENEKNLFSETVEHDANLIKTFSSVFDQYEFRLAEILKILKKNNFDISKLSAVIGRGGYIKPVKSGTYAVKQIMVNDLKIARYGEHASNLGAIIAFEISKKYNIPAYITDPTIVDEMSDIAKITGVPEISRKSQWHPLNQKACARRAALEMGITYENANFIVAHLGGGITVAAHEKGIAVDVNDGLWGDGPFSLQRSGKLPVSSLVELCFQEGATFASIKKKLLYNSGLLSYCGTTDARKIEKEILNGNKKFALVFKALAYNISKEIGSLAIVLKGCIDAIVITGGLAYVKTLVDWIKEYVGFLGRLIIYPGGFEMEAMSGAADRVLNNKEKVSDY